jgi:hypothetical protein
LLFFAKVYLEGGLFLKNILSETSTQRRLLMSKKKRFRNFPKKVIKQRPSWRAVIVISGNGNGFKGFDHKIYFGAFNGGEAKNKALPKIQRFLDVVLWNVKGSPKVDVLLEKVSKNGNGTGGVPSYVLRANYSYSQSLIGAKRPSQVFKETN